MRVWRICNARYVATAFSGEGAVLYAGRWHRRGTPVVYTSESRALAALELLVHLHRTRLPPRLVCFAVDIPDSVPIAELPARSLPQHWYRYPALPELQDLGSGWAEAGESAVLKLPSAVVRGEYNYLLNPRHSQFTRLWIGKPEPFELDLRLLRRT
jgi:RES domain-containing protein